jgi:hypothetical protein
MIRGNGFYITGSHEALEKAASVPMYELKEEAIPY